VRQKETARIVGEAFRAARLPWPEPSVVHEFDEFQAEAVLEHSLPRLIQEEEQLRKLNDEFQAAATRPEKFKAFQRIFEIVIARWAHGEILLPDIEAWPEFCQRVASGLERLSGNGTRGQRIVVFSSGGPIGVAMQRALHLPTESTLRSAWMVINSAYTEFLFSGQRFTLSSYNSYPHLTDPGLITFR
jgi:broad specificity phosphatase PhoE